MRYSKAQLNAISRAYSARNERARADEIAANGLDLVYKYSTYKTTTAFVRYVVKGAAAKRAQVIRQAAERAYNAYIDEIKQLTTLYTRQAAATGERAERYAREIERANARATAKLTDSIKIMELLEN